MPARRALDKPIAMACLGERAPCLPRRTCFIFSRTNSPAAVLGLFPARRSFLALSITAFSGMVPSGRIQFRNWTLSARRSRLGRGIEERMLLRPHSNRNRSNKKKPAAISTKIAADFQIISGSDLLSRAVSREVPLALEGLTSVFEMGTGVTPPV